MTITVNGETRESSEGSTLTQLLDDLGMTGKPVVIELNGEPVLASAHESTVVPPDARIEIITLAAGG